MSDRQTERQPRTEGDAVARQIREAGEQNNFSDANGRRVLHHSKVGAVFINVPSGCAYLVIAFYIELTTESSKDGWLD